MEELAVKLGNVLLSEYGILGLVLIALAIYIVKKERDHREERKELVQSLKDQNATMVTAFDKNTTVLTEVKTLIQTISKH